MYHTIWNLSISQFFFNQNYFVFCTRRLVPQNRKISADSLRTFTVVAFITIYCTRCFTRKPLGIKRSCNIPCTKQCRFIVRCNLISTYNQVNFRWSIGNCRNTVACIINIDNLAIFRNSINGADIYVSLSCR